MTPPVRDKDVGSLAARGVSVSFEGVDALREVTLELRKGELLGLIGPNGAGKTTLVNVLSGFQPPATGGVHLAGDEASDWSAHRLARAGVSRTFQSGRYFERLTVAENVEIGAAALLGSRRAARALVAESLKLMGLAHLADGEPGALTHGQERRLGIARALAMSPTFLLLDEPAAGLNEHESSELAATIAELPRRLDAGVLLIDHDMQVIMAVCERIQVLDHGTTIADGTPEQVRADPAVIGAYLGTQGAA